MNLSRKKIYQVVIRNCGDNSIALCMGFYSERKKAEKRIGIDLRCPMSGTRVREVPKDAWEDIDLPSSRSDTEALLYGGTEWTDSGTPAFDWLIVEHELDPVL